MDEFRLMEILKEWFRDGNIKIEHEVKENWTNKELKTRVLINDEIVYETEVELESK